MNEDSCHICINGADGNLFFDASLGFGRHHVVIRWNKKTEQWRIISDGKTIQELFDCPSLEKFIPGLNKNKDNKYAMVFVKHE